ncbi:MAG TPA: hypothetical protein VGJ04_09250, partial [Pirellulales bacterium]
MTRFFCRTLSMVAWSLCSLTAVAADPVDQSETRIKPPYANAPELTAKENVPKGEVHTFKMDSNDSKSYPGLNGHYVRDVWVYIPKQYVPGTP